MKYQKLQDIATISCCLTSVFRLADIIFYNFSEPNSKLSTKKVFSRISNFSHTWQILSVSQEKPHPLFLTDNIKMDRRPSKIQWKIPALCTAFQVFKTLLIRTCKIKPGNLFFFFFCCKTTADIIFHKKKNKFSSPIFPSPLNGQTPLGVTNVFCWCSLTVQMLGTKTFRKTISKTILLFYLRVLVFKIAEGPKCILKCKKLDIFNIKNQILYSSDFLFDLGIIAT